MSSSQSAAGRPGRNRLGELVGHIGGISGLICSTLPVMAYVIATTHLGVPAAVTVALVMAAAVMLVRLWRHEHIRPAIAGLIGVAIGAAISLSTGQSRDFYLPRIWTSLLWAVLLIASVLVRRPIFGYLWAWNGGHDRGWQQNPRYARWFSLITAVWGLLFFARFLVQHYLYTVDEVTWLGIFRIAMGFPLTLAAVAVTLFAIRRAQQPSKRSVAA